MLNRNIDDDFLVGLLGRFDGGEKNISIPLKGVRVSVEAYDFIAEVKVIQCYYNSETKDQVLECKYHFPLDDSAAVCGFQAEYEDGSTVTGVVKEKESAKAQYKQAIEEGKQANLLQQVKRDIFTLSVGNLPPGGHVNITMTYITTLQARDDAAVFVLPTSIAPNYTPQESYCGGSNVLGTAAHPKTSFVPLCGLDVAVQFTCKSTIKRIYSPTHKEFSFCELKGFKGSFQLRNVPMNRDLVVFCQEETAHPSRVSVEIAEDGSMVGMVSIFPQIEFPDLSREFIFLLDRSGSMEDLAISNGSDRQSQMDQAKDSVLLFLHALPPSCTFNIISFGSIFEYMFGEAIPYSDKSLKYASKKIKSMRADLGGTEIIPPLKEIFKEPPCDGGARQIFVLTDGEVCNDNDVFDLIHQGCRDKTNRLFCVGVGANVSRHLCNGMARAGRGTVRYVVEGETDKNLQSSLMEQLKQSLQPSLDNVEIKWSPIPPKEMQASLEPATVKTLLRYRSPRVDTNSNPRSQSLRVFPSKNPPVFNKERFLSFAVFPPGCSLPESVAISCLSDDGPLETTLTVTSVDLFYGSIAHKLAARTAIQEYEDSSTTKRGTIGRAEVLELALANNLASEFTSFIAVSETPCVMRGDVPARQVEIPQCSLADRYEFMSIDDALEDALDWPSMDDMRPIKLAAAPLPLRIAPKQPKETVEDSIDWIRKVEPVQIEIEEPRIEIEALSNLSGLPLPSVALSANSAVNKGMKISLQEMQAQKHNVAESKGKNNDRKKQKNRDDGKKSSKKDKQVKDKDGKKDKEKRSQKKKTQRNKREKRHVVPVAGEYQRPPECIDSNPTESPNASRPPVKVLDLCVLQKANGSFSLRTKLARAMGTNKEFLREIKASLLTGATAANADMIKEFGSASKDLQDAVFATLFAIAAFRSLCSKSRSIWELHESKALAYQASAGCSDTEQFISCIESKLLAFQTHR